MYTQLHAFNTANGGHVPGACLRNVRLGYGVAARYPNAITDWANNVQHKDRSIPAGVAVPLYYAYKTDGHINVQLPDGRIWSDGDIYSSLSTYLNAHPAVTYAGWGERVDGVPVIQLKEDVMSPDDVRLLINAVTHQKATDADIKAWTGLPATKYAAEAIHGQPWQTQNEIVLNAFPKASDQLNQIRKIVN